MSKRRLPPKDRQKNLAAYAALETFEDYSAANPEFTKEKALAAKQAMEAKQNKEIQTKALYDGDKDDAIDAEWEFHRVMQGVDKQVIAQYGEDSNQVQALGLKKKSEKRTGKGRQTTQSQPQI